jgi:hypothetical protein
VHFSFFIVSSCRSIFDEPQFLFEMGGERVSAQSVFARAVELARPPQRGEQGGVGPKNLRGRDGRQKMDRGPAFFAKNRFRPAAGHSDNRQTVRFDRNFQAPLFFHFVSLRAIYCSPSGFFAIIF